MSIDSPTRERQRDVATLLVERLPADVAVITEVPADSQTFEYLIKKVAEDAGTYCDFRLIDPKSRWGERVGLLTLGENSRIIGDPEAVESGGQKISRLLLAQVQLGDTPFTVLGGKFDPPFRSNGQFKRQCERATKILQPYSGPKVFAGDVNGPRKTHLPIFAQAGYLPLVTKNTVPDREGARRVCKPSSRAAATLLNLATGGRGAAYDVVYAAGYENAGLEPNTSQGLVFDTGLSDHRYAAGVLRPVREPS